MSDLVGLEATETAVVAVVFEVRVGPGGHLGAADLVARRLAEYELLMPNNDDDHARGAADPINGYRVLGSTNDEGIFL